MRDLLGILVTVAVIIALLLTSAVIAGTWVGIAAATAGPWLP